jgi:hypothetical protein
MFETVCAIPVDRPRGAGFGACAAVVTLSLFSTGCLFHKKQQARVFVPPPPRRLNTENLKPPPIFDPPDIVVEDADTPQELAVVSGGVTEFPAPPPARRTPPPAKPTKPVVVPPAAVETTPATPKIAQIFTPDQLRENNRILDESLDRVQKALEALGKRNLTAEQKERVAQIRDFQTQAKQAREEDLVTAVSLAKHADLLAKDLLDRLP